MQSYEHLILDVTDCKKVFFACAFCSRETTHTSKKFEKKPLCSICTIRSRDSETAEESISFLEEEFNHAKNTFFADGLVLLETKQSFRPSKKCLCSCSCGKNHKVLLADMRKENYRGCPSKRSRKGQGASLELDVRSLFESKGCKYIGEYQNNKTPVRYICSCGKEAEVATRSITEKWKGCRECSYKARAARK